METAPAKAMTEKIICFRESLLPESAAGEGTFYDGGLWDSILSNLETVRRDSAENDPSFRQLVAYAVIRSGGHVPFLHEDPEDHRREAPQNRWRIVRKRRCLGKNDEQKDS